MARSFLVQAKDADIVKAASSGGVFESLARAVLLGGGAVVGAAFDETMILRHRVVERVEDLPPLLKSKYVRSDFACVLPEVTRILQQRRDVLFVGTPCSIAAVQKYCKNDPHLITLDLLCHGTPSPKHFASWIQELEKHYNSPVVKYDWRCKDHGWAPLETRIDFANGTVLHQKMDAYFFAFLNNLSIGETCLKCPYSKIERLGDLTIGDAWGLLGYWHGTNDNTGISLVLTNTEKGEKLLASVSKTLQICTIPLKVAVQRQPEIFLGEPAMCRPERCVFKAVFEKTNSLTEAVNATIRSVRTDAKDKIQALKKEIKQSRWKTILPIVGKNVRRRKKEIKKEINYFEQVLSDRWDV